MFEDDPARTPPSLWIYGENDSLFPMAHSRENFDAFKARGGDAEFAAVTPPHGVDGHQIVDSPVLWEGIVSRFLVEQGLALEAVH